MSRRIPSPTRAVPVSALLALSAGMATAQAPVADSSAAARRGFADSWFWGVKGGAARFGTITDDGRKIAPLAGFDWLITRRRAALLLSGEQQFFQHTSAVAEPGDPGMGRVVDLKNARRYSASVLAVPGMLGRIRPYVGLGLAFDVMDDVTPRGDFASMSQRSAVHDQIDEASSKASMLLVAGGQVQFGRAALFLQGNGTPAQTRSLWNRGGATQLEFGFRYNLAPAKDREL
jgi:hypothetical protein